MKFIAAHNVATLHWTVLHTAAPHVALHRNTTICLGVTPRGASRNGALLRHTTQGKTNER